MSANDHVRDPYAELRHLLEQSERLESISLTVKTDDLRRVLDLTSGLRADLAECRRDRDRHYLFLADIRAASGVGAGPMMTDLPAELRKLRERAERAEKEAANRVHFESYAAAERIRCEALTALKALIAVRPFNWDDEVDDPEGYRAWRDAEELLRRLGELS